MPHFVNRSNAHRRFRSNANRRLRQRNLQLENNTNSCSYNLCIAIFLYFSFFLIFHNTKNFIVLNVIVSITGIIVGSCCYIQDRYRLQDISNELSDIESDNEIDNQETMVDDEIVNADAEVLQIEFVSPPQLYENESLTSIVLATPIVN